MGPIIQGLAISNIPLPGKYDKNTAGPEEADRFMSKNGREWLERDWQHDYDLGNLPANKSVNYNPIHDYGLIGDMHGSALVGRDGSIDWCCIPRFDSAALFSRLLDANKGGFFKLAPANIGSTNRRYLPNTNILETTFVTSTGTGVLVDFMPVHRHASLPGGPWR